MCSTSSDQALIDHYCEDIEQQQALIGLELSSAKALQQINMRQQCRCGRKRMYFCYDCRKYVPNIDALAPKVKLPVQIDIIKHQLERNGKSTSTHCLLLAPDSTRIFDKFTDVPDYKENLSEYSNTVVVYPSKDALSIDEYVERNGPIRRFVFLDATWWTVKRLCKLPQLEGLPKIRLCSYKTRYWRPQKGFSDEYLATIEAIYYAVCENYVATRRWNGQKKYAETASSTAITPSHTLNKLQMNDDKQTNAADGEGVSQFDDLLFWFFFFRSMIEPDKRKNNR